MNQDDRQRYLSLPLIGLFAYTALSKLQNLDHFRKAMQNQPLPEGLAGALVWALPLGELLLVGLLLYRPLRSWGFLVSAVLLGVFTAYAGLILLGYFGWVPCSCGGILERLSWEEHLVLNGLFLALSLWGLLLSRKPDSPTTPQNPKNRA